MMIINSKQILPLLFVLFISLTLGVSSKSHAQNLSDTQIKNTIEEIIAQRHPEPNSAQQWKALGPRTPHVILSMLRETESGYRRLRLTEGLSHFDNPEATEYLKQQALETQNGVLRHSSLRALTLSQGEKELEFIETFLEHADPQTRLAAAEDLKRIGTPRALEAYENYLAKEILPWVKDRLKTGVPRRTPQLVMSTKASDQTVSELLGTWEGYWVEVDPKVSRGIFQEPVQLTLKDRNEMIFQKGSKVRTGVYSLKELKLTENKLSAQLGFPTPVKFTGKLSKQKNAWVLECRVPELRATLILTKSNQ